MNEGIVGCGADKFTAETRARAKQLIAEILSSPGAVLVSGRSPVGGIDVWAEEWIDEHGGTKIIHPPQVEQWGAPGGYRDRNLLIARDSDTVHVIVVKEYPPGYSGRRFRLCYHCKTTEHVKSGGCWTAKQAKQAVWHVI